MSDQRGGMRDAGDSEGEWLRETRQLGGRGWGSRRVTDAGMSQSHHLLSRL